LEDPFEFELKLVLEFQKVETPRNLKNIPSKSLHILVLIVQVVKGTINLQLWTILLLSTYKPLQAQSQLFWLLNGG
jgi:hypothetical protein